LVLIPTPIVVDNEAVCVNQWEWKTHMVKKSNMLVNAIAN